MFLQNPIYNFTLYNIKVGFITTHFTGYQAAELETSLNISRILKQRIHACMFERTKFDIDPYLKICCISNSQRSRILTSCNCTARDPPHCSRCGAWTHLLPQDRTEQDHGHLLHQHHHHQHQHHHHHHHPWYRFVAVTCSRLSGTPGSLSIPYILLQVIIPSWNTNNW